LREWATGDLGRLLMASEPRMDDVPPHLLSQMRAPGWPNRVMLQDLREERQKWLNSGDFSDPARIRTIAPRSTAAPLPDDSAPPVPLLIYRQWSRWLHDLDVKVRWGHSEPSTAVNEFLHFVPDLTMGAPGALPAVEWAPLREDLWAFARRLLHSWAPDLAPASGPLSVPPGTRSLPLLDRPVVSSPLRHQGRGFSFFPSAPSLGDFSFSGSTCP
jgi:hypothetical protein